MTYFAEYDMIKPVERRKEWKSIESQNKKPRTSSEVKRRYNDKTYDRIVISVKKETAAAYKAKCENLGISYSQPLHEAIKKFIEEQ